MFNKYRVDFPILNRKINGKSLVYLDNASTSQIPRQVLDALIDFETNHRANIHRGVHTLSEEASKMYDEAREKVSKFIGAVVPSEVIFVRNTTEAINLVAYSWGRKNLDRGDIILVSEVEHHSNLVPWQVLCKKIGCELEFIPINKEGKLEILRVDVDWDRVRLVSLAHVSNVIGRVNDIKNIVKSIKRRISHDRKMPKVFVDGAQSIPHIPVNVQKLGCDFFAFSGHKMYGPMGIGVLWISRNVVDELEPFWTGGGMINEVTYAESSFISQPERFEAGTPNISGAIGLGVACDFLTEIGMENIREHELDLVKYALDKLKKIDDIVIYGGLDVVDKSGVIAFNVKGIPSHDLATVLDTEGIAVRSGHHCVMPWHRKQKITTTARISFALYNTKKDIDQLIAGIDKAKKILT